MTHAEAEVLGELGHQLLDESALSRSTRSTHYASPTIHTHTDKGRAILRIVHTLRGHVSSIPFLFLPIRLASN